ncbi:hypothetical protein RRG08_027527 [Elysia crispata]|uniref:Uncharacterized protein n=1 Tax=Elysia crispata TaxID=231223 RepID=A0AAE1D380_9GAST|nr:hypothetical protein RRG08_027527 [Elysia crispata]
MLFTSENRKYATFATSGEAVQQSDGTQMLFNRGMEPRGCSTEGWNPEAVQQSDGTQRLFNRVMEPRGCSTE